jgi:hypothetical protein
MLCAEGVGKSAGCQRRGERGDVHADAATRISIFRGHPHSKGRRKRARCERLCCLAYALAAKVALI